MRLYGDLIAIETGSDKRGFTEWLPKYILALPAGNGEEIIGVYATDGIKLIGVTIYRRLAGTVETGNGSLAAERSFANSPHV